MLKIKTMNAIAESGLEVLREANCEVGPDTEGAQALLIRSAPLHDAVLPEELLCISRAGIGVDNIPIDRCTEKGIAVFNTPGANADAVKELVICALLLSSRDVTGGIEWVKTLAGQGDAVKGLVEKEKNRFVGPEIAGKKLGVIGLGAIGARVANAALQLGMEVYGYDPFLSVASAWNLPSKVKNVTELGMLFHTCDYITIHVHCTPETRGMINETVLSKAKPGLRMLNLARGELVDDDAMLAALADGRVSHYVTDFPNGKLAGQKGVLAFPHLGASTPEAEEKCAVMAAEELLDYLKNGNITNSVNFPTAVLDRLGESRLCLLHKNQPRMLNQFLTIISEENVNVEHMLNKARGELAYTIFDTTTALTESVAERMRTVPGVYRVRLL